MAGDLLTALTWEQALAWRMERHRLVKRAAPSDLVGVVGELCGLHAQVMSAAELSLWARIDGLERHAVQDALWKQRALVKLWAMRGTLHLLPSVELGIWLSVLGTYKRGNSGRPEMDVLVEAVHAALDGRFVSRENLALAVEQTTGVQWWAEAVRSSWGWILKPASFRGMLCFAPSQGGRVRFTTPATWIGGEIEGLEGRTLRLPGRLRATHGRRSRGLVGRRAQAGTPYARGAGRGSGRGRRRGSARLGAGPRCA